NQTSTVPMAVGGSVPGGSTPGPCTSGPGSLEEEHWAKDRTSANAPTTINFIRIIINLFCSSGPPFHRGPLDGISIKGRTGFWKMGQFCGWVPIRPMILQGPRAFELKPTQN